MAALLEDVDAHPPSLAELVGKVEASLFIELGDLLRREQFVHQTLYLLVGKRFALERMQRAVQPKYRWLADLEVKVRCLLANHHLKEFFDSRGRGFPFVIVGWWQRILSFLADELHYYSAKQFAT